MISVRVIPDNLTLVAMDSDDGERDEMMHMLNISDDLKATGKSGSFDLMGNLERRFVRVRACRSNSGSNGSRRELCGVTWWACTAGGPRASLTLVAVAAQEGAMKKITKTLDKTRKMFLFTDVLLMTEEETNKKGERILKLGDCAAPLLAPYSPAHEGAAKGRKSGVVRMGVCCGRARAHARGGAAGNAPPPPQGGKAEQLLRDRARREREVPAIRGRTWRQLAERGASHGVPLRAPPRSSRALRGAR